MPRVGGRLSGLSQHDKRDDRQWQTTFVRQNEKPVCPDQRAMKNLNNFEHNTTRKGRILTICYLLLVKEYNPGIIVDHAGV